jgi:hypothetical protein
MEPWYGLAAGALHAPACSMMVTKPTNQAQNEWISSFNTLLFGDTRIFWMRDTVQDIN